MNDTSGIDKARETVAKLKGSTPVKNAEPELDGTKELARVDYSKYAGLGMKNITAEDIRPPVMFLVQSIKDKSELVDLNGQECPDGSFYIKSFKEIIKSIKGYIIWVRKDHYQVGEDPSESDTRWEGSRMYRAIFVRKDSMMPLAITFKKSSLSGLSDLFTVSKVENLPIFLFEVELKNVITTNKKGQSYFKTEAVVIGKEKDPDTLNLLFTMSKGYDGQEEVKTQDDEVEVVDKLLHDSLGTSDDDIVTSTSEDVSDDVPF